MAKATNRKNQMQFTPTPELRQIIEARAEEEGLSVSAFLRTTLLDVFRDNVEQLKAQRVKSNNGKNGVAV